MFSIFCMPILKSSNDRPCLYWSLPSTNHGSKFKLLSCSIIVLWRLCESSSSHCLFKFSTIANHDYNISKHISTMSLHNTSWIVAKCFHLSSYRSWIVWTNMNHLGRCHQQMYNINIVIHHKCEIITCTLQHVNNQK